MEHRNYQIPKIALTDERHKQLKRLEEILGYTFKNITLLHIATTHSSYANENRSMGIRDNERLEFLGDVVLNLVVSDVLFRKYPEVTEGELTKRRSVIVSEPSFAKAARIIGLGEFILLGKGESLSGGSDRDSLLADAFEALCGAIFIDCGYAKSSEILIHSFEHATVEALMEGQLFRDYKTQLQEHYQRDHRDKIVYTILNESGPDHDKVFHLAALVGKKRLGEGYGKSKKEAEQMAARHALIRSGVLHD